MASVCLTPESLPHPIHGRSGPGAGTPPAQGARLV